MKSVNNPFMEYIYNPIIFILIKLLPNKLILIIESLKNKVIRKIKSSNIVLNTDYKVKNEYDLDDIVINGNLKESIDILAICRN